MVYITDTTTQFYTIWNYVYKSNNFLLRFKSKDFNSIIEYDCVNSSNSAYYLNIDITSLDLSNLKDCEYLLYIYNKDVDNSINLDEYTLEYVVVSNVNITKNSKTVNIIKKYGR